ncbi:MAG: nucleotide pyrophosphohydrolase [Methanobacteriota archaeon]
MGDEVVERLRAFVAERDWRQFHSPKELAASIAIEAGELLEVLQWKDPDAAAAAADPALRERLLDEVADVLLYGYLLADALDADPRRVMLEKIEKNGRRYPVDRSRGRSAKYTDL